jgi:hypothetical protein
MTVTCETCRFWHHLPRIDDSFVYQSGDDGICKLRPPVPVSGEQVNHCGAVWHGVSWERPDMRRDDFCGEHKPRDFDNTKTKLDAETYQVIQRAMNFAHNARMLTSGDASIAAEGVYKDLSEHLKGCEVAE